MKIRLLPLLIGLMVASTTTGQYVFFPDNATISSTFPENAVLGYSTYFGWQGSNGGTSPKVTIQSPAQISGFVEATSGTNLLITGGSMGRLLASQQATVKMSEGSVIGQVVVHNESRVTIYGGTFGQELLVNGFGAVADFFGGELSGDFLVFRGTLNIYSIKMDKTLIYTHPTGGYQLFELTGTLSDGTILDRKILEVDRGATANIVQGVPEPATFFTLIVGCTVAMWRKRLQV